MKKKKIIYISLLISIFIYVVMILFYSSSPKSQLPFLEPFSVNYKVTEKSLLKSGFKRIPEDVPLLGKQIGDTSFLYQLDKFFNGKVIRKNWMVYLNKFDSVEIAKLIHHYDATIISEFKNCDYENLDSISCYHFDVQNINTKEIFACSLNRSYNDERPEKFQLNISKGFTSNENN